MAVLRIKYIEWIDRRLDQQNKEGPFFEVYPIGSEHYIRCVNVLLGASDTLLLQEEIKRLGNDGKERLRSAVIRYAIQRIEQGLREDIFPYPPSDTTDNLFIERDNLPILRQMLQEKTCSYQIQEGRDLLCSAASAEDKAACGQIGFRFVAPTSRAMCYACNLPDTDYLCSHFMHPKVIEVPNLETGATRQLSRGMCDIGRAEVQQPEQCRAGTDCNECWEWLIEPRQEQIPIPTSPLALPEALDFLDTAWRVAFGKQQALLRLRGTASSAKLSQPCTTRADFESQLSALDDILKAMDIPDALLSKPINGDQTFLRLLDCLQTRLEENDYQEVDHTVNNTLRSVNRIRVALQHSAKFRELPTNLANLGIPYPPQWGEAWDRIRAATIEALRVIREKVLWYADKSS